MIEIKQKSSPSNKETSFLSEMISSETKEYGMPYPFGFFAYDESDNIIAGANGTVLYGKIYTDQLWVDPKYRNQGIAKQLMNKVHEFGQQNDCVIASVSTFSFQNALNFYKKLGYEVDFERAGYPNNAICYFLRKQLSN